MDKRKRWQAILIIAVMVLTVYNILPTIFFYSKPLKDSIDLKRAGQVQSSIAERVNGMEEEAVEWARSYAKLLGLKPTSIKLDKDNPRFLHLTFANASDANSFRKTMPRAGSLISFAPAQLSLYSNDPASTTVTISRRIPLQFDTKHLSKYFEFGTVRDAQGNFTDIYRALVTDRVMEIASVLGGPGENGQMAEALVEHANEAIAPDLALQLAQNLLSFVKSFDEKSPAAKRYFATLSQIDTPDRTGFIDRLIAAMALAKDKTKLERIALAQEKETAQDFETVKEQRLNQLLAREKTLADAESLLRRHTTEAAQGQMPWTFASVAALLKENPSSLSLAGHNPFIERLIIDYASERITFVPYADITARRESQTQTVDQILYNEMAFVARQSGETLKPSKLQFEIALHDLPETKSFLALRLSSIAESVTKEVADTIATQWMPQHADLKRDVFPIWDFATYQKLPAAQKKLGLVIFAPVIQGKMPPKGMRMNSVYVIAKGIDQVLKRFENRPDSAEAQAFMEDFQALSELLQKNGFIGYSAKAVSISPEFANDYVFEGEDYYQTILKATREDFTVRGTKRYAILEFSTVEQRIVTENKIDNRIHEDLLKWRDDYHAAQVDLRGTTKYDVPAPTRNAFLSNLKLSTIKYFRGDERKVLHWGLDMSGGKTVQIELRDSKNQVVTNDADLRQGINELYSRVNKMGVSEVSIRQEGSTISLDFPGSQSLSAGELVKASTMYFHIVNEKFMTNPALAEATQRFLQEVWNEALITGRKDSEELSRIAWRHLYGSTGEGATLQPQSPAAKTLFDNGLRLAAPDSDVSNTFNDQTSKIAILRGDDYTEWHGQTHPLLLVFNNFALEGSNLENVHASYDPSKGNFLAFGIQGNTARNTLEAWTSTFAKEKVSGTPLEAQSRGRGWRMAVILNGSVITAPALDSTLRDNASITGSFTQREISLLEADLKAGSLSFTPRILSEKNVSPELGSQERMNGIIAMVCSLFLVLIAMVAYYRFGGIVASVAVLFNLLVIWAALQNIGATLTLAGIAGVILTVAMAVDANVLVFERIREEFALSGRIASAVHAGYRKALSAIVDSNVTTIIAAVILMNFDSGPIRGFAVTLIIGIVSSLFTALFMTRFFFSDWVQNPANKELKMASLFRAPSFNFLKYTKPTLIVSAIVILIGSYFLVVQRQTILGMDFTGGYALTVELPPDGKGLYRSAVDEALSKQGLSGHEFQVREMSPENNVRIFLSRSLQNPGRPFYNMPEDLGDKEAAYAYQNNPKIAWIVNAMAASKITLSPEALSTLDKSWTAISGQMSDSMRNGAILGIALALSAILVYITLRFEFKYAISATLCLAHDVLFCIGVLALAHSLGLPIQIDLHTVAALTMIVGYSLNDTIIVFDRIREEMRLKHAASLSDIINHALNVTLNRTLMTSGITILALLPLLLLGGSTIIGFAFVMLMGVIFGTLSSLFIAAPLMQFFHKREKTLALNGT